VTQVDFLKPPHLTSDVGELAGYSLLGANFFGGQMKLPTNDAAYKKLLSIVRQANRTISGNTELVSALDETAPGIVRALLAMAENEPSTTGRMWAIGEWLKIQKFTLLSQVKLEKQRTARERVKAKKAEARRDTVIARNAERKDKLAELAENKRLARQLKQALGGGKPNDIRTSQGSAGEPISTRGATPVVGGETQA
jgi:hypothetical protein